MFDPRDEWRQIRTYWTDDRNFQPIQPPARAARLRPWLYSACIVLVILGLAPFLHLEVSRGTVIGLVILAGVGWLVRWLDQRDAQPPTPVQRSAHLLHSAERPAGAPTRFPPAYVAETKRLTDEVP
jgi:hypothetical protein